MLAAFAGEYDLQGIPLGDVVVLHQKLRMFLHHLTLQYNPEEIEQIFRDSSHQCVWNGALTQLSVILQALS